MFARPDAGIWIAHDEHDSKGGCFRNHETACRFAVDEFGANAEIVIQPLFSVADEAQPLQAVEICRTQSAGSSLSRDT